MSTPTVRANARTLPVPSGPPIEPAAKLTILPRIVLGLGSLAAFATLAIVLALAVLLALPFDDGWRAADVAHVATMQGAAR